MKPGPWVFVAVMLSEYACGSAGKPAHGPVGNGKDRGTPAVRGGAPNVPVGPLVSTIRQGVTPMNGIGLVTSASTWIPREPEPGLYGGTVQFGTVDPTCPHAVPDARTIATSRTNAVFNACELILASSRSENSS